MFSGNTKRNISGCVEKEVAGMVCILSWINSECNEDFNNIMLTTNCEGI